MSRKNGNRWDRKRYYQIYRGVVDQIRYPPWDKESYKRTQKGIRRQYKQLTTKSNDSADFDIHVDKQRMSFRYKTWVPYEQDISHWSPHLRRQGLFKLKLKPNENRHLPQWMQHAIEKNRAQQNQACRSPYNAHKQKLYRQFREAVETEDADTIASLTESMLFHNYEIPKYSKYYMANTFSKAMHVASLSGEPMFIVNGIPTDSIDLPKYHPNTYRFEVEMNKIAFIKQTPSPFNLFCEILPEKWEYKFE